MNLMKKLLVIVLTLCTTLSFAETLPNGVKLPEAWPPRYPFAGKPVKMPLPYIDNRPDVIIINVGRQLFVDDFLVDSTDMVRVNHHARMYEGNPVIAADCPTDFRNGNVPMADPFSGGVWYDETEGVFKVWYRSGDGYNPVTGRRYLYTGYAVSEDGKHWVKPELDVIPGTNVTDTLDHDSRSVWLDKTETDPEKRYKSVFVRCSTEGATKYDLHYSSDGIHWGPTVALSGRMQDRSTVNWNPFRQQWIASLRVWAPMSPSVRARAYIEDPDLENLVRRVHWIQNELGYGADSLHTGYVFQDPDAVYWFDIDPDEKRHPFPEIAERYLPAIYNFDATAYESIMVGEYSSWKGPENRECAQLRIQKLTEFCLGYSRDGFHYFRPDMEPVMESRQEEGAWNWGNMQPAIGNPCIVGDSLYLYCGGHRRNDINWDCWTSTGLGILRRDGFVSMHTDASGTLLTPPVRFDGKYLFVNAEAASLAVEILSEDGTPLKGYTFDDCKALSNVNGTKVPVVWSKKLRRLAGRSVRFRFRVEQGDLYSFWISPWKTGESRGFTGGGGPGLHPSGIDLPLDLPGRKVRKFRDSFKPYIRETPPAPLGMTFNCADPMVQNVYRLLEEACLDSTRAESCHERYTRLGAVPAFEQMAPDIRAALMESEGWSPEHVRKAINWFYNFLAGVKTDEDDITGSKFKSITVAPPFQSFPKEFEYVTTTFETESGRLLVSWETGGNIPRLRILAPEGIVVKTSYTAPEGSLISFDGDGLNHDFPPLMDNR